MHCVLPAKSMVCPQSLRRHVQRECDVEFGSAASRGCNAINVFARMPVRLTSIPIWTWAGGDPASISMPPTGETVRCATSSVACANSCQNAIWFSYGGTHAVSWPRFPMLHSHNEYREFGLCAKSTSFLFFECGTERMVEHQSVPINQPSSSLRPNG